MQSLQSMDYLVFFSLETTHDSETFKYNYRKLFTDATVDGIMTQLR